MRLLVLDDDAAVCRLISRAARISGFEAFALTDPSLLLSTLERRRPDVVVLDLQLGQQDGIELLRQLASIQFTGCVVLMTGFSQRLLATTQALGEDLGLRIEAALHKPIEMGVLEDVLQRLRPAASFVTAERVLVAIRANELNLALEPVVRCPSRDLYKLQVLLRWNHPEHGTLPDTAFVPIAQSQNLVEDALIGWLLRATVEAYQILAAIGIKVPLAVNMSANNLLDQTLPDRIMAILQDGGMPPERLWLEISQAAPLEDATEVAQQLTRLRLKKVNVSLADFGARYSSLNLLRRIPYSEMKIDRSLISDVDKSHDARVIVGSIIELARKMEMGTVATGVETEQAAMALEQLGIGALQGRLIATPMPVELVQSWLAQRNAEDAAPALPAHHTQTGTELGRASLPLSLGIPAAETRPARREGEAEERRLGLSSRQADVLRLLAEGKSVKDIARALGLSIGTVKVHLSRAYAALGAHNRVEAVLKAGYLDQSGRSIASGRRLH